jgi:hypothetical protein
MQLQLNKLKVNQLQKLKTKKIDYKMSDTFWNTIELVNVHSIKHRISKEFKTSYKTYILILSLSNTFTISTITLPSNNVCMVP